MRTDLIIAENHAAGLFDDPTAPGNIMTIDRNRMLESLFPPTVKAFDGQSIKQKWANLDQSGLSEMQKSLLNAGKAPAVVDASQTFNSVGGDNVYTGMLSPYHGNGTAQRLSMTRGLQVSIEIPIN